MVEQAKSAREETTMTHLETVQAIIHQLDKRHGIYADLVSDTHQEPPLHGVNVWIDHHDRYPSDTAWVSDEVVTWGPTPVNRLLRFTTARQTLAHSGVFPDIDVCRIIERMTVHTF